MYHVCFVLVAEARCCVHEFRLPTESGKLTAVYKGQSSERPVIPQSYFLTLIPSQRP